MQKQGTLNMCLEPKPFAFADGIADGVGYVYTPDRTVVRLGGYRLCSCVYLCEQFKTYPTVGFGVKCIPENAICKFDKSGHKCCGHRVFVNGEPSDLDIRVKIVKKIFTGLTRE